MRLQSRSGWLPCLVVVTGVLGLPSAPRVSAQTTRQVPVEALIYDLKNPDAARRQAAVRELGSAKYRAAIPDLVAMVHDPVDAVRRELEFSLERMEDIQALQGFIALASDSQNDIRARATTALVSVHLPRERGITATLSKLGEAMMLTPDRDLEIVVEPDVPIDPGVIETLRTRLGDSERGIRRTAIRGLGILRAKLAVPDLIQVVREDRDEGFRFEAVRAIRKIDDRSIADQLVGLLTVNNDTVRHEVMATLGSMRYRGAVPELTRIVEQAKKTDVPRIYALAALADIGDPTSMPLFQQLKADKSEPIRLYANEGIARTAAPNQKTEISSARLTEKSTLVRTAQAFALLRIGEGEYLDELIRALDKSAARELAKEYLLETPPADRQALFAPRAIGTSARADLAEVLGRMGDMNAMARLQEMSHDADSDVARAAELATRRLAVANGQER